MSIKYELLTRDNISKESLASICKLANLIYKENEFSIDYIKWRFFQTPFPINFNIAAHLNGQTLIGHASLAPRLLYLNGKNVWAAQSIASIVNPNYQRKGTYTEMAKLIYKSATDWGIEFIWGFPNSNSHYGRKAKLNWSDIYEIPTKTLLSKNISNFSKLSINTDSQNNLDLIEIKNIPLGKFDDIRKRVSSVFFVRNNQYYHWRYVKNPRYKYYLYTVGHNIDGYMIIKYYRMHNGLYIDVVEIEATDLNNFEKLILVIISKIKEESLLGANIWINTNHPFAPLLEKYRFQNTIPITYFSYFKMDKLKKFSFISDFRKWYVSMGDSDIY